MLTDTFHTIAEPAEALLKDRGSKFLAFAYPIATEKDVAAHLQTLRKLHPKANHHCYAWRIGLDDNQYRTNDDGEPSGTAGKPILGQMHAFGLTNVLVVVVRYFGGTLLGTSGLIQAYRSVTESVLHSVLIVEKILEEYFLLRFQYAIMPDIMNALKKLQLPILSQTFDHEGLITTSIRQTEAAQKMLQFKAAVLKVSVAEAALTEHIEGLKITPL